MATALVSADAHAAVPADAVPDAPAPFSVTFDAQGLTVRAIAVGGVAAGERVALNCHECLGQTSVEAVATGPRHVFRPKLRLSAASRLELTVHGRNFARTRAYVVRGGRLRLDARHCVSVADNRRVRCNSITAPRPWATMNVCTPTAVGVRAASPAGGARRDRVAARFRLQYAEGARWVDVPNGTSPWTVLGRADRSWQGGYTFRFSGIDGRTFRGLADFEWRRGTRVVRRVVRLTSPRRVPGFSSSVCAP
ncbi:hypothetical protein OJ962_24995 [Solirubrobacter sp. CPCC 204708]|uniref:IPT/TIG domain-containing protein n=1 Tax=Solirubrobacter deserti TaxID=2282478 RepID=A0ABT4RQD0_9ACTN|nr:hypothetical protein [Solirubrobacter deserti]